MKGQKDLKSLDWKWTRKVVQNASNLLNNTFWWQIRPIVGSSISLELNMIEINDFSAERGGQSNCGDV